MPTAFSATLRSLAADGAARWALRLIPGLALLILWSSWLLTAHVTIYETTGHARLTAAGGGGAAIEAPTGGRIAAVSVRLGQEVVAGQLLVQLDAGEPAARHAESLAHAALLAGDLTFLDLQAAALRQADARATRADSAALAEAASRVREAQAAAELAAAHNRRQARLHAGGLAAAADLERARLELEQREAAAAALGLAFERLRWQQRAAASERRAALLALASSRGRPAAELALEHAAAARLAREIERLSLRAPQAGVIAALSALRPGALCERGARLAVLAPRAATTVAASFPAAAAGRIRAGQPAWVALSGFSPARYGRLRATVTAVAGESHAGEVRVELTLAPARAAGLPVRPGLPATVTVEVERVSAVSLLLRATGKLLALAHGGTPR
ncbi:MAG TPA: HlyD family efflux transporter periplasmic adaptor subunit [Thermoanaerobaculia bacterium]|nr:HlyD family efflux transporter periplasmic adaptor subunit [Thermoanaerobaculia bacterium]